MESASVVPRKDFDKTFDYRRETADRSTPLLHEHHERELEIAAETREPAMIVLRDNWGQGAVPLR